MPVTTLTTTRFAAGLVALLVAVLVAARAGAQELPLPTAGAGFGDASVASEPLPAPDFSSPLSSPSADSSVVVQGPASNSGPKYLLPASATESWDLYPAAVETTGTSLDRGYWFSEVEAMMLVRQWNRQGVTLLSDGVDSLRTLGLGRSTPGREGSVRFTLGRFLYRDEANRDHAMELTIMGGGEFGQNSRVFADNPDDPLDLVNDPATSPVLNVPFQVDGATDISFDGAESSFVQYDSRLNSWELNYTATTRLTSDRMELLPSGQWVRRADSGFTYQFLAGARYVDLTENIAWTANNLTNTTPTAAIDGETGEYLVRTSNDIFGPQLGFGANFTSPRFSVDTLTKIAALANDAKSRSSLAFRDPANGDERTDLGWSNSNRTDTIAVLGELSIVGRYHIRPNLSWRMGYHLMMLTHVALAPHQLDFEPDDSKVNATGDLFYHGLTTGLDFTW